MAGLNLMVRMGRLEKRTGKKKISSFSKKEKETGIDDGYRVQ